MIDEIKSFPPLPASVLKIQELCRVNDVDINALTKVIKNDPMLSANILKSVNSPLYGMSKEILSIHQAVMLFGVSMIRGFAAANAIKRTFPLDLSPYGITIEKLTEASILQQALVREWYSIVDKQRLPSLLIASFLMELGKLIVAKKVIQEGRKELFLAEILGGGSLLHVEKSYISYGSYEIAGMMFKHWHFESSLIETLRTIDHPQESTNGAILHVITRAITIRESLTPESLHDAYQGIENFRLDRESFETAVKIVKTNMGKI